MIAYRQADFGTPLRAEPATGSARYHRGGEPEPTQYLCLHPLGPWAELMRNHGLRTEAQLRAVQARTWALEARVADLPEITFGNADRFGITAHELVADDREPCRELAARLRAELPGLIVPSAALPGTRNVVLFGARVAAPYLTEPVSEIDVPSGITAHGGRPIASLLDRVRFEGDDHAALEAWRRGAPFVFAEPDWELARA